MRFFRVNKPSGFYSFDTEIIILDSSGKPFYFHRSKKPGRAWFNMPVGLYQTSNVLTPAPFRTYNVGKLPKPERKIKAPEKIKFSFGRNKNKASILLKEGEVLIDSSFLDSPKPFLQQIKLHEVGHYYYSTEYKCDLFAAYFMLKKFGYNPSQVGSANKFCLSDPDGHRVHIVKNFAKKSQRK